MLGVQVLQQIQIRPSQLRVAEGMLGRMSGHHEVADGCHCGAIVQLNMGEGKTRVIMPMLVLGANAKNKQPTGGTGFAGIVQLCFLPELYTEAVNCVKSCFRRWSRAKSISVASKKSVTWEGDSPVAEPAAEDGLIDVYPD